MAESFTITSPNLLLNMRDRDGQTEWYLTVKVREHQATEDVEVELWSHENQHVIIGVKQFLEYYATYRPLAALVEYLQVYVIPHPKHHKPKGHSYG